MATVSLTAIQSSDFFETLSRRHRGVLVIDYDSTIARLGSADCVFPYPTVQELIDCILVSTGTRVVLATRRPAQELRSSFVLPGPEICTPEAALSMEKFSGDDPLAYLGGDGGTAKPSASRVQVCPRYWVGSQRQAAAPPEELAQFLAEWLRACAGEVC
jgi:hypothetical protein